MKIRLEANEIGAILKEWARMKYKTHNINCDILIGKTSVEAELEIIMSSDEITEERSASMAELLSLQKGLPRKADSEPDFTPDFSGTTEGL